MELLEKIRLEVSRRIVGQDHLLERILVAILADGHILLEGVPGLAKTKMLTTLASCLSLDCKRIQFTPDLLPADLIGTEIYRPQTGEFNVRKGPLFTNILLADEINRAPAKVQSALLQAMQERQVTIGQETFKLTSPFLVLATQNPLEQEGTYALPEAQVDRFLMKVKVNYPSYEDELKILRVISEETRNPTPIPVLCNLEELNKAQIEVLKVHVDEKIERYIVSLVQSTRTQEFGLKGLIDWGASPRASLALLACARALAYTRGQPFVSLDDIKELAPDILRHRVILTYEADARGISVDDVIQTLLKNVSLT